MERGIEGMEWMGTKPNPNDPEKKGACGCADEWGGTGLCPEAQADGVPCTALGRECDTCGRSFPATASRRKP